MGPGFKYHVVTIAAVFFALAIGLVMGSLYVSPSVPKTTVLAIEALRKSQSSLDKNNADLKTERDALQTCLRQSLPLAIKGRLSGQTVALIQTNPENGGAADLRETLTQAGARVASLTTLDRTLQQPDELLLPRLASLRAADPNAPQDRAGVTGALTAVFQSGDAAPNARMPLLQSAGLLRYDADSAYTAPVSTIILLTGSRSEATALATNVDTPLIAALQKAGLAVYACETQDVVTSSFPAYRAANLQVTTVDRIDTDPGRWQLVSALAAPAP